MGAVTKIFKKIIKKVVPTPAVVPPPPPPEPEPTPPPPPPPVAAPTPPTAPKITTPAIMGGPKPEPAPVAAAEPAPETTADEKKVARKKTGMKGTILTGSKGLIGDPTIYKKGLLG